MKRSLLPVLALVSALVLAGCGEEQKEKLKETGTTIGEKAGQAWTKVKTFTVEQKDKAIEFWDENKDGLNERYEKVKDKGGEALAARKKDFEAALAKAKEAGKDGWEASRDAVKAAFDAFEKEVAKHE